MKIEKSVWEFGEFFKNEINYHKNFRYFFLKFPNKINERMLIKISYNFLENYKKNSERAFYNLIFIKNIDLFDEKIFNILHKICEKNINKLCEIYNKKLFDKFLILCFETFFVWSINFNQNYKEMFYDFVINSKKLLQIKTLYFFDISNEVQIVKQIHFLIEKYQILYEEFQNFIRENDKIEDFQIFMRIAENLINLKILNNLILEVLIPTKIKDKSFLLLKINLQENNVFLENFEEIFENNKRNYKIFRMIYYEKSNDKIYYDYLNNCIKNEKFYSNTFKNAQKSITSEKLDFLIKVILIFKLEIIIFK